MKYKLKEKFEEIFGNYGDIQMYFAPGRVNLIGEHTDYNGGHVFPCALTIGTYGVVRKRSDKNLRFYSLNFKEDGVIESNLHELIPSKKAGWTNYPKGVMWAFEKRGFQMECGMDLLIYGDIPNGSGLSSSASLEVLVGTILKDLYVFDVTPVDIALIGQYSENNFNGINCGIMDQFASAMGKKDHAIFLDTNTLEYEYAPIALEYAKIVIVNSKVKHSLVDSAYNERRNACEKALEELKTVVDINSLGALSIQEFEMYKDAIKSDVRQKRAKHAVYENQRTIKAVEALGRNDVETFGRLMIESHVSLRDDYEVSCLEVDFLAEYAWGCEEVIGARITGGGFGGCTVNIVKNEAVNEFAENIKKAYEDAFGIQADVYIVSIGSGACKIRF